MYSEENNKSTNRFKINITLWSLQWEKCDNDPC